MDYLLLFILVVIVVFIPFNLFFKNKIFSPTNLILISYGISILLAILGLYSWNTEKKLDYRVFILIIFGLLSFGLGEVFSLIKKKKETNKNEKKYYLDGIYHFNKYVLIGIIFVSLLTIIFILKDQKEICSSLNYHPSSLSDMVYFYRQKSSLFSLNSMSLSFLSSQLIKICNIFSVCCSIVFINNTIKKDKVKKNIKYIIPIFINIFIGYLQSGRGSIFKIIVAIFIVYFVLKTKEMKDNNKNNYKKIVVKTSICLIAFIILFYYLAPLFGRNIHTSFIDYISFYFGCPIPSLNNFLTKGSSINNNLFGEHIFYSIYEDLDKLNIINYVGKRSLPFIRLGEMYTNVYTSFFRSYIDFGIINTFLLTFVSGFFYGKMYRLCLNNSNIKYLIVYALFSAYIIDMFRDETFFSSFLSITTIIYYVLIVFVCYLIFKPLRKVN